MISWLADGLEHAGRPALHYYEYVKRSVDPSPTECTLEHTACDFED
jgi:hypothetical protein